jgi:hypothetical protein
MNEKYSQFYRETPERTPRYFASRILCGSQSRSRRREGHDVLTPLPSIKLRTFCCPPRATVIILTGVNSTTPARNVCFRRDNPQWASLFKRFLDHTQRRITVGRTHLDEWSARRRDLYLTTHTTQQTDTHAQGEIRTHNLSRRAAADLRLRPRDHWDRLQEMCRVQIQGADVRFCLLPGRLYPAWITGCSALRPLSGYLLGQC